MKIKKRRIAGVLIALVCVLCLTSCTDPENGVDSTAEVTTKAVTTSDVTEPEKEETKTAALTEDTEPETDETEAVTTSEDTEPETKETETTV